MHGISTLLSQTPIFEDEEKAVGFLHENVIFYEFDICDRGGSLKQKPVEIIFAFSWHLL